nr:MAG TPA: hypothetical protein [Caudoviricetes sp.]
MRNKKYTLPYMYRCELRFPTLTPLLIRVSFSIPRLRCHERYFVCHLTRVNKL